MAKTMTVNQRVYQKAPIKMELLGTAKAKRSLRFLAFSSFVLATIFFFLMNPFLRLQQVAAVLRDFTANTLSEKLDQGRETIAELPVFLKQIPNEIEKQSFRVFDWMEWQVNNIDWQKNEGFVEETESIVLVEEDLKDLSFYIEIPSLDLYQKVNPQINANDEDEYQEALKDGVAHALGSAFPGEGKLVYIFGHSTNGVWNVEDYNAVFYQIKDLEEGEKITLYWGDERFDYQVIGNDVIPREDTDFVNDQQEEDLLILQTCWPPGTSWQRLFISAKPISLED